jgi:hypothetical protein
MSRLCERPGCSDIAAVSYGMRTAVLVFWLDALREEADSASGVLCQRHGDSVVVPRGWTLDDRRDDDLHLFRPPEVTDSETPRRFERREAGRANPGTQLALDGVRPSCEPEAIERPEPTDTASTDEAAADQARDLGLEWHPTFDAEADADDHLDGLRSAQSPLLSRAFGRTGWAT